MVDKAIIKEAVFSSVDKINEELEEDEKATKSADTIIFGEGAEIDSMLFINLIILIQEALSEQFDQEIALDFQKEMSTENSLITLEMFADYIVKQLDAIIDE